jgi:hypothetical protein
MSRKEFLFHLLLQFIQFIPHIQHNTNTMSSPIRIRKDTIAGYYSRSQLLAFGVVRGCPNTVRHERQ